MADARIAQKGLVAVDVDEGRTYLWCRYGRSASERFRDGSDTGIGFAPPPCMAEKPHPIHFRESRHSGKAPLCDGTHSSPF